jgi:putative peptide zinc metalloprotease protein
LAASSAESAAIERVSLIRDERERLALKAPIDGMVFIESRLPPTYEDGSSTQSCGSYFDSCNEGIAVQSGVPICMVGSEKGREAILYVDQKQASLVHRDQLVNLLVPGDNAQQTRIGTVIEISSTPSFTKPTARAVTEDPSKPVVDEGHYQIRVALEESAMPLPVHMTGYARIHIEPISLTARLVRLIFQSVRF